MDSSTVKRTVSNLDAQIEAARCAQRAWAQRGVAERARRVGQVRRALAADAETVIAAVGDRYDRGPAETLTTEIIPLADAARFIARQAVRILSPRRLGPVRRPAWLWGVIGHVQRVPYGVVAIIAPGNYRLLLAGVQILQALAAGNAVVVKPAPGATAPMAWLRRALIAAGVPADLFQLVDEDIATAQALAAARIDKLALTGSAATGRAVARQLAARTVPAIFELSGDDAAIVLDSADIGLAARAIVWGLGLNGGATCIAPRRIIVARTRYDALCNALNQALTAIDARTVAAAPLDAARAQIAAATGNGWTVLGRPPEPEGSRMTPCVLAHAEADQHALPGDLFAPIASMIAVEDVEAILACDRASDYALGAAIFGKTSVAVALGQRLCAGVVTINDLIAPTADPRAPFAGAKASGHGATRGAEGLIAMTRPQSVLTRRGRARPHLAPTTPEDAALFTAYLRMAHGQGLAARWAGFKAALTAGRARSQGARNTASKT